MKEIEIINDESGVPKVHLHGEAKAGATAKGISKVLISLSHSEVRWSCIYLVIDADRLCRLLPLHLPKHRDLLFFALFVVYILSSIPIEKQ